ncbi:Uncharacterised protein [Burkholderia cepacia]|uniref:Uncharacterized protein n=1 Tax=Burkholderia cepacia TaxID=292 RepID=A0AAE8NDU9_BURCE|nr:Uncharacterised protein [Burkholderia cepacia]
MRRSVPARSITDAMPADTITPTAMPVSKRAAASMATDDAVANNAHAISAAARPGSRTGLRP